MAWSGAKARVLHCLADAETLSAEHLAERLPVLGTNLSHTITGISQQTWAAQGGASGPYELTFARNFPSLAGKPSPRRLNAIATALKPYDLVLTYGYGAIDVAMAHTMFSQALGLPPLIHHESALGEEQHKLRRARTWYRRIALGKSAGLVVPTEKLEAIALGAWQQPMGRVKRLAPGVDTARFEAKVANDALRGLVKREEERWIGMAASSGSSPEVAHAIKALARTDGAWHLLVLDSEGTRDDARDLAGELDIGHRLHFPDSVNPRERVFGLLDIFVDRGCGGEFPLASAQAMAAGLPVLGWVNSELGEVVDAANLSYLAPQGDEAGFVRALGDLAGSKAAREEIGSANRKKARRQFSLEAASERYRRLYASALGREIRG